MGRALASRAATHPTLHRHDDASSSQRVFEWSVAARAWRGRRTLDGETNGVLSAKHVCNWMRAEARLSVLAVVLAYLVVALVWMLPVSLDPASRVYNPGDPLHLAWIMAWDAHQIVRAPWALFESNSFYPYPRSLTFGDHLLPEALMVAPLFWLTGNAVLGFNVAVLLGLVLSATTMFLLVRDLTRSLPAAFVAGAIYAFNGFTQRELPRVHVLHLEWWPLALLFLMRFVRSARTRDAALFAAALALQGLSGTYYLVYSAALVPFWVAAAWIAARRWPTGSEWRRLAVSGALAAVPVAVVMWPYVETYRAIGFAKEWEDGVDVLGLLDVRCSWLWGRWLEPATSATPQFVGLFGAAALCAGVWAAIARREESIARAVLAVAGVPLLAGLILSWGMTVHVGGWAVGPGPAALLHRCFPLLRGMAGAERAGVLLRLGAAVFVGFVMAQALEGLKRKRALAVGAVVAVLLVFEQWASFAPATLVPTGSRVPQVYRYLATTPTEPVVEVPPHRGTAQKLWSNYLYFSTYHWRPELIGRTSLYPPAHNWLVWTMRSFPDDRSLEILDRLGVHTAVVHPMAWYRPKERDARMALIEAAPGLELLRRFDEPLPASFVDALRLGGEQVYRVRPRSNARVAPCQPQDEIPREGWRFRSSIDEPPTSVRDGDPRTGWTVREEGRHTLQVKLAAAEQLSAISIDVAYPWTALPPGMALDVRAGPAGAWEAVPYADGAEERWEVIQAQLHTPHAVRWTLRFSPRVVSALRLAAGSEGKDGPYGAWSIGELRMYRRCEPVIGEARTADSGQAR